MNSTHEERLNRIHAATIKIFQQALELSKDMLHEKTVEGTIDYIFASSKALHEFYFEYVTEIAKMAGEETGMIELCEDRMRTKTKLALEKFVRTQMRKNSEEN